MRRRFVVMTGAAAVLLSGCAVSQTRSELARLQSQVGLLDERVGQLERMGPGGAPASPAAQMPEGVIPVGSATAPTTHASRHHPAPSTVSSVKPSTREIQQALKNAGFYQGSLDGKMGPATRDAVKEFQRVHGLKDDGVVGRQTWEKLRAYADLSGKGDEAGAAEALK